MIAGIELGGTKCIAVLGDADGMIAEQAIVPTTDPAATLAALDAILAGWRGRFDRLGIASFGPLELDRASPGYGRIVATPKPGWTGVSFPTHFASLGVPIALTTDVIGAALAEGRWGGAKGMGDHIYITIGTGVGVGAIVGGRPAGGVAHGEAGHMRIARQPGDRFVGSCPFHGDCIEGLVSGSALAARAGRAAAEIAADDPLWSDVARDIAGLLHNLIVTLAPQRIAIGGGVMTRHPALFAGIRAALADSLAGYGLFARYAAELDSRIGPPALGDRAGPLGAIAVALAAG